MKFTNSKDGKKRATVIIKIRLLKTEIEVLSLVAAEWGTGTFTFRDLLHLYGTGVFEKLDLNDLPDTEEARKAWEDYCLDKFGELLREAEE